MSKTDTTSLFHRARLCVLPALASSLLITACGGGNDEASAPAPVKPPEYQADVTADISGLVAYYDFESRLSDASGNAADAEVAGPTTADTGFGTLAFDVTGGIHPLSEAAVFNEIYGLLLPGNSISYPSFTVSMWVNPEPGNTGPWFFARSERGTLQLDHNGLTVSGMTGFGTNGDETLTFTSDEFDIPAATWSHIAFKVEHGAVDIYLNGEHVYQRGTLAGDGFFFEDGFQLRSEAFADLFSGTVNTVAVGIADSEATTPFAGKIDNLRIYDYALYYGNITVLSREVTHEGPAAITEAVFADSGVELSWTFERFNPETISFSREAFQAGNSATVPAGDTPIPGTSTQYTDTEAAQGDNYRYTLTAINFDGKVYVAEPTDYVRVPGSEPYAAVSASLNEQSENIELALYSENIAIASYDVLRDTDDDIEDATVIATGLTADSYTDAKDDDFPLADGTPYFYWVSVTDAQTTDVTTSLALPTASATAAGEFIPPGTFLLEENMDGYCGTDGTIDNNHVGFGGDGFVNTDNEVGSEIRWRINVAEDASYNVHFRYANGTDDQNRWGIMTANGEELINPVNLPPTGAWAEEGYMDVSHMVTLEAGIIDLALISQTENGLANFDSLRFVVIDESSSAPTGVPCAE